MRLTAVNACVRVLAESAGSLPLPIYRRQGRSRIRVPEDPRWGLLNDQPNPEMYAMELHETATAYANLWGHGYTYVIFNDNGQPAELWPLRPDRTQPRRTKLGRLFYETRLDSGERVTLMPEEVIDVKALFGLSPIRTAREALAAAIAAEDFGGHFWANSARPGGVIEVDHRMDEDEYEEFKQRWNAGHQGLKRSQLVGILTGATWREVGVAPELAQFIETRQFGVREIARLFRVPPHMIGDLEGTVTRASIEQQAIDFVVHSLRPWLVRSEQAIKVRLFNRPADRAAQRYPEFLVDGLMRGDTKSRYEAYSKGIQFGWLSRADVRELENLPEVPGLDTFLVPVNMTSSKDLAPPAGG
jgi:HK97 family phage portal protein